MNWYLRYSPQGPEWGPFDEWERGEIELSTRKGVTLFWRAEGDGDLLTLF